ncbi:MAG: site-2 protease family protein [Candidatus Omnitrophica bacterium]|nr:site-2 protease family protein [Candidatus Omnitrophota bacterium]
MNIIFSILAFLPAVIVHELAHGYVAYRLGDPTARNAGRLTLNPQAHIDPVGTFFLPLVLVLMHSPIVFGWAKPVPIDPSNFRDIRKGLLYTSVAGPASNVALALLAGIVYRTGIFSWYYPAQVFLVICVLVNLVLCFFNLIPIPPLDGSGLVSSLLPVRAARRYGSIKPYGFIILIALLYGGLLHRVIMPVVSIVARAILGH